jgi:hypothetical protein
MVDVIVSVVARMLASRVGADAGLIGADTDRLIASFIVQAVFLAFIAVVPRSSTVSCASPRMAPISRACSTEPGGRQSREPPAPPSIEGVDTGGKFLQPSNRGVARLVRPWFFPDKPPPGLDRGRISSAKKPRQGHEPPPELPEGTQDSG